MYPLRRARPGVLPGIAATSVRGRGIDNRDEAVSVRSEVFAVSVVPGLVELECVGKFRACPELVGLGVPVAGVAFARDEFARVVEALGGLARRFVRSPSGGESAGRVALAVGGVTGGAGARSPCLRNDPNANRPSPAVIAATIFHIWGSSGDPDFSRFHVDQIASQAEWIGRGRNGSPGEVAGIAAGSTFETADGSCITRGVVSAAEAVSYAIVSCSWAGLSVAGSCVPAKLSADSWSGKTSFKDSVGRTVPSVAGTWLTCGSRKTTGRVRPAALAGPACGP